MKKEIFLLLIVAFFTADATACLPFATAKNSLSSKLCSKPDTTGLSKRINKTGKTLKLLSFRNLERDTTIYIGLNPHKPYFRFSSASPGLIADNEQEFTNAKFWTADSLYWIKTAIKGSWRRVSNVEWVFESPETQFKIIMKAEKD